MIGTETLGVVLAGGLATRMGGGDKPLMPLGASTILDHVIERVRPRCAELVLNANGDPGRFARFGLPVVPDGVFEGSGPLAGILAGLDWAATERPDLPWVLSVPGDTPFLPVDLLDRLHEARRSAGATLACASSGGRVHPVAALWPVSVRASLRTALGAGERRVGAWMKAQGLSVAEWDAGPLDPFANLNTPGDLARAELALAERSPSVADAVVGSVGEPADEMLDLRGLKCPLPALKTRAALAFLQPGRVLRVECTDPLAGLDVPNAAREAGASVVGQETRAGLSVFRIVVAGSGG